MERELPAMFAQREIVDPERFSFHSSRVRMRTVTPEELAAMNAQATIATLMLADALNPARAIERFKRLSDSTLNPSGSWCWFAGVARAAS